MLLLTTSLKLIFELQKWKTIPVKKADKLPTTVDTGMDTAQKLASLSTKPEDVIGRVVLLQSEPRKLRYESKEWS